MAILWSDLRPYIRDRSRVRESRMHGSVRGVPGNGYPYRDPRTDSSVLRSAVNCQRRLLGCLPS